MCRRAENGEVVWQSPDLPDYAGMEFVGLPILARGTLFVAGKSASPQNGQDNQPRQFVLAIRPHDGKLALEDGSRDLPRGRALLLTTVRRKPLPSRDWSTARARCMSTRTTGILARLDAESGMVDWGYGYPTDPVQSQGRFFFFFDGMPRQAPTTAASTPLQAGDAMLIKGAKADRLCAIDPDRMKVLWERPIAKSARLIGVDD